MSSSLGVKISKYKIWGTYLDYRRMYVNKKTVGKPKVSILLFIYIISMTVLRYIASYENKKEMPVLYIEI